MVDTLSRKASRSGSTISDRKKIAFGAAIGLIIGFTLSSNLIILSGQSTLPPQYDCDEKSSQDKESVNKAPVSVSTEMKAPEPVQIKRETPRYHELSPFKKPHRTPPMTTAFIDSSIVLKAPWFQPRKICVEKCCAETVAISLDQDDTRIKNTIDGLDLADVLERGHELPDHLIFHANTVSPDIIPCFQPGTIVHADNYGNTMRRWFEKHRLLVTVPYVLISSETDGHSPIGFFKEKLSNDESTQDKLLIKWYGMNPDTDNVDQLNKFVSFPLGLSKYHEQMPYLTHYLRQTNFSNPFAGAVNKDRWIKSVELQTALETTNILFVKFGINPNSQHRKIPFAALCSHLLNKTNLVEPMTRVSCTLDPFSMSETYAAASKYLFGLSPPGNGMDCYRTYELWMLGVIPIIERNRDYPEMFRGLPYIQVDRWDYTQAELIKMMQDYIASDEFQNNDFSGWERLFLRYWRRMILADTGRDKDIIKDENGREYYQAWKYSLYVPPLVAN